MKKIYSLGYPDIGKDEFKQIKDYSKKLAYSRSKSKKIEQMMAEYCNVPYAVAVSNGTVAIDIALKQLELKLETKLLFLL